MNALGDITNGNISKTDELEELIYYSVGKLTIQQQNENAGEKGVQYIKINFKIC